MFWQDRCSNTNVSNNISPDILQGLSDMCAWISIITQDNHRPSKRSSSPCSSPWGAYLYRPTSPTQQCWNTTQPRQEDNTLYSSCLTDQPVRLTPAHHLFNQLVHPNTRVPHRPDIIKLSSPRRKISRQRYQSDSSAHNDLANNVPREATNDENDENEGMSGVVVTDIK